MKDLPPGGYGSCRWLPGRKIDFAAGTEIDRARLLAGIPSLKLNTNPPSSIEDFETLRAFIYIDRMNALHRQDVSPDKRLENVPLWKRTALRSRIAQESSSTIVRVNDFSTTADRDGDYTRPLLFENIRESRHLQRYYKIVNSDIIIISNVPFVPPIPPSMFSNAPLRVDGRFGEHEPTRYPQMHEPGKWYMPFVPATSSEHSDIRSDLAWYIPDIQQHFIVAGCGIYQVGFELRNELITCCNMELRAFQCPDLEGSIPPLDALDTLQNATNHLCSQAMTEADIVFTMGTFQRSLLEVRGWLNYVSARSSHARTTSKLNRDAYLTLILNAQGRVNPNLRGVFVNDSEHCAIYGNFGVPTWWFRVNTPELVRELERRKYDSASVNIKYPQPELRIFRSDDTRRLHRSFKDSITDPVADDFAFEFNDAAYYEPSSSDQMQIDQATIEHQRNGPIIQTEQYYEVNREALDAKGNGTYSKLLHHHIADHKTSARDERTSREPERTSGNTTTSDAEEHADNRAQLAASSVVPLKRTGNIKTVYGTQRSAKRAYSRPTVRRYKETPHQEHRQSDAKQPTAQPDIKIT